MSEKENTTPEPEQQEENPSEEEQPPKEEQREETPPHEEDQKPREEKPAEQERKPEEEPKPEDKPGEEKPAKEMMSRDAKLTGEELYYLIVAVNVLLQNILSLLLDIYVNEYAMINQLEPHTNALCLFLSIKFPLLKAVVKNTFGKLYNSDESAVLPDVDSKKFDCILLLQILNKLFLNHCNGNHHCKLDGECIAGKCCNKCNHSNEKCAKCNENDGNQTVNCFHKCKFCGKQSKECSRAICCNGCNTCLKCNEKMLNIESIVNKLELSSSGCLYFAFTLSLVLSSNFRNLFGHLAVQECKEFIENGNPLKKEFKMCKTVKHLKNYVTFIFSNLERHAGEKLTKPSPEVRNRISEIMVKLELIFECNVTKQEYLNYLIEAKGIFVEAKKAELENAISRLSKELKDHVTQTGETVVKTLTQGLAAENADNKRVILDEMKKSKEMFTLGISIEKNLVGSLQWLSSRRTFKFSDLRIDGPVAKIIKDALIHVFNKRLGSRQMEFTVLSLMPKNESCSLLSFQMKICGKDGSPLPPHLRDESHEETKNIQKEFISLVKAGIINLKYEDDENADIEVNIHKWKFGSIIIEGTVLYINGNFKEEQQDDILSIIKKAGESVFNSNRVYIQLLNPSIDLVVITADIEVMKYIKENEKAIEVGFLEKLNSIVAEGMKEDKDKVTLSQNLEKGFVSKVPFEKDEEIFKKEHLLEVDVQHRIVVEVDVREKTVPPEEFFGKKDPTHGSTKRVMLYRYLQGRFSTMLNYRKTGTKYQFVYFDAFAGTGKYLGETQVDVPFTDPSYGSPVVALHALLSAMEKTYTSCSVLMIFEDANHDYLKQLKENVDTYFKEWKTNEFISNITQNRNESPDISTSYSVENTKTTQFQIDINFVLSKFSDFNICENMPDDFNITPVFSFIDPFGFKNVSMIKIRELIGYKKDVLTFMMSSAIKFPEHINRLFGTETSSELKEYLELFPRFYQQNVAGNLYENKEDERRNLKAVKFSMKIAQNPVIYHMIFFTDELRALRDMKYGMVTASKENYAVCFTDELFDSDKPTFHVVTNFDYEADYIYEHFKGQTLTFGELKEWILTKSPFQIHSKTLKQLEKKGNLIVNTYGEERRHRDLPAYVGVNNDDPDYNENRPYRNHWIVEFQK